MPPKIESTQFFYITCKGLEERQKRIETNWQNVSNTIPLNKFTGTHYNDFGMHYLMECLNVLPESRIALHPPSLAVIKSHLSLWKRIIDRKIPYAFIMEDDVAIPDDFIKTLENIYNQGLPKKWDLLYFGILKLYGTQESNNDNWIKVIRKPYYNNGFHAYLLTYKTAKKLYSLFNYKTFEEQIDIFFRNNSNFLNLYAYRHNLINQLFSTFQSERLGRFVREEIIEEFNDQVILNTNGDILIDTKSERLKQLEITKQFETINSLSQSEKTINFNEQTMVIDNGEFYVENDLETSSEDEEENNTKKERVSDIKEEVSDEEDENSIDLNTIRMKLKEVQKLEENNKIEAQT